MRTHRPAWPPPAQLLRASLLTLAVAVIGALPLLGQAISPDRGSLPTALAQASPFGPASVTFNITVPPSISIETPAPAADTGGGARRATSAAGGASAATGAPAQAEPPEAAAAKAAPETARPSSGAGAVGSEMVGYASWYGTKFQGRLTANGETYDMYQLTAANRTLPFGTLVRVTNLDNGKSVVVRINDRGPFVDGRIIDLSKAAAEIIGMPGIAKVRLQVVGTATAVEFVSLQRDELAAAHLSAPPVIAPDAGQGSRPASAASGAPGRAELPAQHRPQVALSVTASAARIGSGGGDPAKSAPLGGGTGTGRPVKRDPAAVSAATPQPGQPSVHASASPLTPSYPPRLTLQVGAFRDAGNAARLERLLAANGFSPRSERAGELTRVLIPQVRTSELAPTKKRLASLGITTVLIRAE